MKMVKGGRGGRIKRMDTGESGNPKGRPKKGFSAFIAECRAAGYEQVSLADVVEAYRFLMSLPVSEVFRIAGDPARERAAGDTSNEYPVIIRRVAAELMGKRGQEMLKQMLDRTDGMAAQKIEAEHTFNNTVRYKLPDGTEIEI